MKPIVYIEYNQDDEDFANTLSRILNHHGIQTKGHSFSEYTDYKIHAENVLKDCDFIIWILSKNIKDTNSLFWYSCAITEIELSEENRALILPVFIDMDISIPVFLLDRVRFFITRDSTSEKYDDLVHTIRLNAGQRFFNKEHMYNYQLDAIKQLHQAYKDKNLTLFCGAGISIGSGIPSWNELLVRCFLKSSNLTSSYINVLYDMLSKDLYLNQSILARMIKTSTEQNYIELVHHVLYENIKTNETPTISAIANLCMPSKDGGVRSIITYNFDDLLEYNFEKNKIKFQNKENNTTIEKDHIPIYHVHGFLPRNYDNNDEHHVVFSEDEYHEEYDKTHADETIAQLTALTDSFCLYIGISFTDPNMRRIADVFITRHQNYRTRPKHFIIKQKPRHISDWKHNFLSQKKVLEQIMFLQELDAESFGFKIIWVDKFDEINDILNKIKNGNS